MHFFGGPCVAGAVDAEAGVAAEVAAAGQPPLGGGAWEEGFAV